MQKTDLSFVIPARNEEGSVVLLYREIIKTMKPLQKALEIIYIDDGSADQTLKQLEKLHKKDSRVKVIQLRGNFGKSIALQAGFDLAAGEIIFTLDADLQDQPKEIPKFIQKLDQGYDLVSGWKKKRHDPLSKTLPSKLGNWLMRTLTGVKIHDLNCGYKLYRKEVLNHINLYGEIYKFIPIIASKQNFKVGEVEVEHVQRKYGKSKFGWERNIKGFLDLLTVIFLTGYLRKPGHFFGTLGLLSFFVGFLIGLYITYIRLATGTIQYRQPLLFLGMLLMIIGIQFVSTGLLAEMVIHTGQKIDSNQYIKKKLV